MSEKHTEEVSLESGINCPMYRGPGETPNRAAYHHLFAGQDPSFRHRAEVHGITFGSFRKSPPFKVLQANSKA